MTKIEVHAAYSDYVDCLNRRDWPALVRFVHPDVRHNGRSLGLDGYRAMLEQDCAQIPDLFFRIELLLIDPPHLGCRLAFDVTPTSEFLGLAVDGQKIRFSENVFYRFDEGRIREVWSVIDKYAIEAQLAPRQ